MGDEDDTHEPNLNAQVFPSEDEWPWSLTEDDVPGASLNGKDPGRFNLNQLKLWLKCRGISSTGMTKAQAVDVVTKSLNNSDLMKQPITDPKYPYYTDRKIQVLRQNGKLDSSTLKLFPNLRPPVFPATSEKWDAIAKTPNETIKYLKMFNNKTILDYFSVMADMRDTGFHNRALLRGNQHYAAQHVFDLITCLQSRKTNELVDNGLYIKAVVKASMKKVFYNTRISLYQYQPTTNNIKIRYAECSCVAGKAGVCGHIAATLDALADKESFVSEKVPESKDESIPCTSKPNAWKGRAATPKRKSLLDKVPVENYSFNKVTIMGENVKKSRNDVHEFNPFPSQTDEEINQRMANLVTQFSTSGSCNFRGLPLWKLKYS